VKMESNACTVGLREEACLGIAASVACNMGGRMEDIVEESSFAVTGIA